MIFINIEVFILIFCLSFDVLIASFAYGSDKIKIPFKSMFLINIIITLLFIISLFLGNVLSNVLNVNLIKIISFLILFCLGIFKLFEFSIKKYFGKIKSEKKFKLFNFNFILQVVNDNTLADVNSDLDLSLKESITLGIALSLDGIAAAISVGLFFSNYLFVLFVSFSITFIMFLIGNILGRKISMKEINLGWLSGLILIILAITKII